MLSSISNWIISIAGVVCLSVMVDLLLPNGQMSKYIKGIFSFIILLVIIMPLPNLLGKSYDFSNIFDSQEAQLQEDYLYQININKVSALEERLQSELKHKGYEGVTLHLNCDIFAKKIEYKSVYVDLSRLVIMDNAAHKDMISVKKEISSFLASSIKLEEEKVEFNE